MMNEFERAELEAEHDGYTNDYQRALAVSSMRRAPDDRGRAKALAARRLNWSQEELRERTRAEYPELVKLGWGPLREIQRRECVVVVVERSRHGYCNPFYVTGRVTETWYAARHPKTGEWEFDLTIKRLLTSLIQQEK